MGSGTTAEACLLNQRKYIGFEINAEYCAMIEERLGNIQHGKSLFSTEKETEEQKEKSAATPLVFDFAK